MFKLWSLVEAVLRTLALAALTALVCLPALQVVLRDLFVRPLVGLEEATRYGLIVLVFLAVPGLVATNEQIRLAEFVSSLPRRLRVLLERLTLLTGAACFGIIAFAGLDSAMRNASNRTPTLDIPFWLFIAPMIIGLSIAALGAIYFALRPKPPRTDEPTPSI